ncbi:hypothetical protein DAEQUDRAFT_605508 [Daedalea quercina L-15889]|uniref:Secreted protein n=1 Tax=Daedalea quercina L-15889 TaxID=1314783 RepID=A0A165LJX7_9APHY|nr:hypothetical protein DAEQUDRAFT_605508 [Daedalea quercina L-15889]
MLSQFWIAYILISRFTLVSCMHSSSDCLAKLSGVLAMALVSPGRVANSFKSCTSGCPCLTTPHTIAAYMYSTDRIEPQRERYVQTQSYNSTSSANSEAS